MSDRIKLKWPLAREENRDREGGKERDEDGERNEGENEEVIRHGRNQDMHYPVLYKEKEQRMEEQT